jgi:ligand-binding sensor domain-containing protein/serine phosphatase RsbU (regulator of sigma subunit)
MAIKKTLQIFFLLILVNSELFSQQYFFRNYSVEDGLPQSSVYCMLQDSRGFIWMGTDGAGVTRFDGQNFETYNETNGLTDNVVRSLMEDSKGNIWIGTNKGITYYDGYIFKTIGKSEGLNGSSVLKIIEGSNGIIWAVTNDGGLSGITQGDSVSVFSFTSEDGLINDFIFDIYEDPEKNIWLGMIGGVNILEFEDSTARKIKNIYKPEINSESVVTILSIEATHDGKMWFGSYGNGLFSTIPSGDKDKLVISPSPVNSFVPDMIIWDITEMKNGELWLATDKNGVVKYQNGNVVGIFNKESGLQSNQILNIINDREGNIWFSSFGQGVMMYGDEKFISYNENSGIKGSQVLDVLFSSDNIFYLASEEGLMQFVKEGSKIRRLKYFTAANGLNSQGANTIEKYGKDQILVGTKNGINILRGTEIGKFSGNSSLGNKDISSLVVGSNKDIWVGTAGGYGRIFGDSLFFMDQGDNLINDEIQTIIEDDKNRIWLGTLGGLVRLEGKTYTDFDAHEGLTTLKISSLVEDPDGNIMIGTLGGGIFIFDVAKDSMPISVFASKGVLSSNTINSLMFITDTLLVAGNDKGFDLLVFDKKQNIKRVIHNTIKDGFLGGENNPNSISVDEDGLIWFGTKNGLVRYDPSVDLNYYELPQTYITGIKLFYEDVDWNARNFKTGRYSNLPENLVLSHNDNHLTFAFTALSYNNPGEIEFSYFLENQSKEWSPFITSRDILFSGLTPGNYTFKVQARNKFGFIGNTAEYKFVINPPFWQTPWFLIPAFALFIILIIVVIKMREKKLINEKIKLEKIVEERTREVVEQKDEIAKQRDVVTYQKKEITDSIHYAERIQQAVLPVENILKNNFSDYFVLFRPKDIVSGDFYWMSEKADNIIFTAADCTGHGVPGAFMSMLGVSFLNKIVNEEGNVKPSQILNFLRKEIIGSLKQEGSYDTNKDGMDIALCSVNLKSLKLQFAGANNPLFLVRKENGESVLNEIKGDKMPVAFYTKMDDFTNHEFELRKGDTIYLFSDGFLDQFGGPEGRKFMKPRFSKMLLENQDLSLTSQKEVFANTLDEWINHPSENSPGGQIDDVILIGVRI